MNYFGANDAAKSRLAFDNSSADAGLAEIVRSREPRDSAADNDDPAHSFPRALRLEVAHHLYNGLDVLDGCFGQYAVPEIEDVSRPRAGALQKFLDFRPQLRQRGE